MTGSHQEDEHNPTPGDAGSESYNLRLYVAGQTPKSLAAIANLKRICEEHLSGRYVVEVIDLLVTPQLAEGDQIVALPTWCAACPRRSSASSAIFRIPTVSWWGWIFGPRTERPHDR